MVDDDEDQRSGERDAAITSSRRCSRIAAASWCTKFRSTFVTRGPTAPRSGRCSIEGESSEVDIQDDIGFALIQMKAETLNKIDAALRRLGEGTYGDCFECGEEIAEARLRALPFAVRCKDCEEAHESVEQRERIVAQRRGSSAVFFDLPTKR